MNNTFITVRYEDALAEARAGENAIMQGKYQGSLDGIPLSLKDNISVKILLVQAVLTFIEIVLVRKMPS